MELGPVSLRSLDAAPGLGWVWVPGYEWAPAWVSWRYGDEYVGWAPLPPAAVWISSVGFNSTIDVECGIAPTYYSFCPIQHFAPSAPAAHPALLEQCRHHQPTPRMSPASPATEIACSSKAAGPTCRGQPARRATLPATSPRAAAQSRPAPAHLRSGPQSPAKQCPPSRRSLRGQRHARPQNVAAEVPRQQVIRPANRLPTSQPQGNP